MRLQVSAVEHNPVIIFKKPGQPPTELAYDLVLGVL